MVQVLRFEVLQVLHLACRSAWSKDLRVQYPPPFRGIARIARIAPRATGAGSDEPAGALVATSTRHRWPGRARRGAGSDERRLELPAPPRARRGAGSDEHRLESTGKCSRRASH